MMRPVRVKISPAPRTTFDRQRFMIRLIVIVTGIQFALAGLGCLLGPLTTLDVWWVSGGIVVVATMQIERYMARNHGV